MTTKILTYLFLIYTFLVYQSCSKQKETPNPISPPSTINGKGLSKIEDVLNGDDQKLIDLLNKVRGSVGKRGLGSKTIWSKKNQYDLGLYISANHVYNISGWKSRNAEFFDINK